MVCISLLGLCTMLWWGVNADVNIAGIDFEPFRKAVARIIHHPVHPITPDSTPLDCHFPNNSVMFTYSSHYTTDLMAIQQRALNASGLGHCLTSRFIRLCLDVKCQEFCAEHHIVHCPLVDLKMLPASDFNKGEYRFFTYLKHILLAEALKVADEAFFFDVDCIVMKNPFIEPQYGRDDQGKRTNERYDIMYQRDRGRGPNCSGSVNSGQIYLRNSTQVQQYLAIMRSYEGIILEGKNGLDQDFVANASQTVNLKMCSLTPDLYTAHCYQVFGNIRFINGNTPVSNLITYHTSCVEGAGTKKSSLLRVLSAVEQHQQQRMSQFIRARRD